MKIFYFNKKKLISTGIIILLVLSLFTALALQYFQMGITASKNLEAVYQGNTGKKSVAITINVDWGEEYIPAMLEEFKKNKSTVTFFVTGQWAEKNPELLKKMSDEGHSIQNHGFKHVHFNSLSEEQARSQIKKAEEVIYRITGKRTNCFAPPYGEQNQRLLKVTNSIKYDLIMWSVDTIDWQKPAAETIVKRVANKVHNDAIILMHPTDPTLQALPELLGYLKEEGYELLTIEQIIKPAGGKNR